MAAILPSLKIDCDSALGGHFLPYQVTWILDDGTMRLAEKSVRIGWTYADAFKNVRKRLRYAKRDYLFATKDQQSAIEYLGTCKEFCELYDFTRSIVAHGEDSMQVESKNAKGESFMEEVKFGYIKFDNGSRIIAFSANPYAMAVFGGDVGLDEFAKHKQSELLWETAQGRVTWGYDLGVWSAHDGTDTLFYQFAREAAAGKGGWNHYRVTMEDALDMGLLEKINAKSGKKKTREEFIQDCKNRARLPEIYEQAYNCNPSGSQSAIVDWATVLGCQRDYEIERVHFEGHMVDEIFGVYTKATKKVRAKRIAEHIRGAFPLLFNTPAKYCLGFDVAASGQGDLACIYVDRKEGGVLKLVGMLTCRTDDWPFLSAALETFLDGLSALRACGDKTGLGMQICKTAEMDHPGVFEGVNFRGTKHGMGLSLMNQLTEQSKIVPSATEHADIAQDFFSLRKVWQGGRWVFSESRNTLNPVSHCDIAWAGALSSHADLGNDEPVEYEGLGNGYPGEAGYGRAGGRGKQVYAG